MQNLDLILGIIIGVLLIVSFGLFFALKKKTNQLLNITIEYEQLKSINNELEKESLLLKEKSKNLEELKNNLNTQTKKQETINIEKINLLEQLSSQKEKIKNLENIEIKYEEIQNKYMKAKELIKELQTKQEETQKSFEEKLKLLEENKKQLKETFENLANEILEKNNEKLTKTSHTTLLQLLNPLQNQMKEFKDKVEFLNKEEAEKLSALQNELKNLKDLNVKLSNEAENLTKALKGEHKTQGNWGELVLEKVLEMSGLREGFEYEREKTLQNEEHKKYRPDVIIRLPNQREIIIDAKTSLNAYQRYIETEDKIHIKEHIKALKNHINLLSEKKYEYLEGINSLDFVFMFVPIENALMLALQNDNELFEYAFKKRVVLVSPTTLLVSLRAIESSWRSEKQAKNIKEVIKSAENLYDKLRGFLEDFVKIEKGIDNLQKSYSSAKNKLITGRGNVIRQIEMLKEKSGIKPKKELPEEFRNIAQIESSNKDKS